GVRRPGEEIEQAVARVEPGDAREQEAAGGEREKPPGGGRVEGAGHDDHEEKLRGRARSRPGQTGDAVPYHPVHRPPDLGHLLGHPPSVSEWSLTAIGSAGTRGTRRPGGTGGIGRSGRTPRPWRRPGQARCRLSYRLGHPAVLPESFARRYGHVSCTRRPDVARIAPMHGNPVPDSYVYVTEEGVARHYADGSVEALAWEDVVEVRVEGVTDSDALIVLLDRNGEGCVVPRSATDAS